MSRCIDADALEKEGWSLHRTIRVDKHTDEYQTKPLKQVPTIEPKPKTCEGCIWENDYSNGPCQYCNRAHEDWYKEKT